LTEEPLPALSIDRFDYDLPPELIAQHPVEPRDSSRLLVVDRVSGNLQDRVFSDLPDLLDPGDLLVMNNTRVIPARLRTRRQTGGRIELLLLRQIDGDRWLALARPARRLRSKETLDVLDAAGSVTAYQIEILGRLESGELEVLVPGLDDVLSLYGEMPLPPYVTETLDDPDRYQTVYANRKGSAAAPTAGLHFTNQLLERCRARGINIQYVTLHVGLDTFQPVKVDDARQHRIHSEWFEVDEGTIREILAARHNGRRIIAVGTTAARTLETIGTDPDTEGSRSGMTSIYITPPYQFKLVDAMITNFHLPRTTLLLMVSALAGEGLIREAYAHAIRERYRFYSFGDAMLIV
jgi:S-adenosylmethionine:tRNA ribosyltransferase-isomerase